MTLTFKLLGHEVWTLELEFHTEDIATPTLNKGIKAMSRWWVKGMSS